MITKRVAARDQEVYTHHVVPEDVHLNGNATKTIQPSFVAIFFVLEQAGNSINIDGEQPQGSSSISRTSPPPPADTEAHPLDGLCRLRLSRTQATLSFRSSPLASSSQTAEGASGKEMGDRAALSGRGLDWMDNGTREIVSKRQQARPFLRAIGPARPRFPRRHQLRRSGETGRGSDKTSSQLQKTSLQRLCLRPCVVPFNSSRNPVTQDKAVNSPSKTSKSLRVPQP
ncbi:hypothetical protein ONZ45_g15690 [Pleurotus djamor]|nr:hypothetical protein ONZ45_g15690 [Pleurotus djamor]